MATGRQVVSVGTCFCFSMRRHGLVRQRAPVRACLRCAARWRGFCTVAGYELDSAVWRAAGGGKVWVWVLLEGETPPGRWLCRRGRLSRAATTRGVLFQWPGAGPGCGVPAVRACGELHSGHALGGVGCVHKEYDRRGRRAAPRGWVAARPRQPGRMRRGCARRVACGVSRHGMRRGCSGAWRTQLLLRRRWCARPTCIWPCGLFWCLALGISHVL